MGDTFWPNRTKSKAVGVRFDWGNFRVDNETQRRWRNFNFQVNDEPENATLKALARAEGTDTKHVSFSLELNADGTLVLSAEEIKSAFRNEFTDVVSENGF